MFQAVTARKPGSADLVLIGRSFFAFALMGFGLAHFTFREFVSGRAPAWPSPVYGQQIWAYVSGLVMGTAGLLTLVNNRKGRVFLFMAGVMIFIWALLRHIPVLAADLQWGSELTSAGKALTLWGGIFTVAGGLPVEVGPPEGWLSKFFYNKAWLINLGRICLGIFLTICGIEHFIFVDFVKQLVPAWIPANAFWTYFTGVALIAGGIGMMVRKTLTPAAFLTGSMIFVWFLVLHIPMALAASKQYAANEWTAVCESLAFSGIAFVLAGMSTDRSN